VGKVRERGNLCTSDRQAGFKVVQRIVIFHVGDIMRLVRLSIVV
jgi:hypothetical protein